jgi:hypothetical protein
VQIFGNVLKAGHERTDSSYMSALPLRLLTGVAPADAGEAPAEPYSTTETILMLVAALALVGGLIHVGAAVDHWQEFHLYTYTFGAFAAIQATWALLILRGASRRVLVLGAIFQLGVVALWAVSRTVGVPIAPKVWTPEEIGVADLVETIGECVTVLAVLYVVARERFPSLERMRRAMVPLLMTMILVSALFGTGAHAG